MTEYKYRCWEYALAENVSDNWPAEKYFEAISSPKAPLHLIEHNVSEVKKAFKAGESDERFSVLLDAAMNALNKWETNNLSLIAMAFYRMGKAVEAIEHESSDTLIKMAMAAASGADLEVDKLKREKKLALKNRMAQFVRESYQNTARDIWQANPSQDSQLSTGYVAALLYKDENLKGLAMKAQGKHPKERTIREWISEGDIRPEYAKKRGRQRKE